jgi:serine/threonine protein kinase
MTNERDDIPWDDTPDEPAYPAQKKPVPNDEWDWESDDEQRDPSDGKGAESEPLPPNDSSPKGTDSEDSSSHRPAVDEPPTDRARNAPGDVLTRTSESPSVLTTAETRIAPKVPFEEDSPFPDMTAWPANAEAASLADALAPEGQGLREAESPSRPQFDFETAGKPAEHVEDVDPDAFEVETDDSGTAVGATRASHWADSATRMETDERHAEGFRQAAPGNEKTKSEPTENDADAEGEGAATAASGSASVPIDLWATKPEAAPADSKAQTPSEASALTKAESPGDSAAIHRLEVGETIRTSIRFSPGDIFLKKYRMIKPLGSFNSKGESLNGMGVVWLAEHEGLLQKRVLKFLRPDLCNAAMINRFKREALILARVKHKNVVSVYDAAFAEGYVFIDMEFVDGDTLTKFLKNQPYGRMNRKDLIWFLKEISDVLELFRTNEPQIVHRDLKPDNIVLVTRPDGSKQLKVLDFGVAKVFDPEIAVEKTRADRPLFLGTPLYMSPEQCAGENANLDCRSDIYSLGVIIYEAITGLRPFRGRTKTEVFAGHLHQKPPTFRKTVDLMRSTDPSVPEIDLPNLDRVQDILFRMLEKKRDLRPSTSAEALEDLLRAIKTEDDEKALRTIIAFKPGEIFLDKYRMIRPLGERNAAGELKNAMAVVWLAEHVRLKQNRVLKFLKPEIGDRLNVDRFRHEGQILSRIQHPNVVSVYDADHTDGYAFIDMEYVDGITLTEFLKRQPSHRLNAEDLRWLVREMTEVLERLRKNDPPIVHRDLKPDNVMIVTDPDGEKHLKILDFGISTIDRGEEPRGTAKAPAMPVGTALYMSPEQCAGESDSLDARSDIYSLGLILFEAVAGRRPFEAPSQTTLFEMHRHLEPPSFQRLIKDSRKSDAPLAPIELEHLDRVEKVIRKALAKDRNDRPTTAAELCRLFEEAIAVPAPSVRTEGRAPASTFTIGRIAAALAVAASVIASAVALWPKPPQPVPPVVFEQPSKNVLAFLGSRKFAPVEQQADAVKIGDSLWPIEIRRVDESDGKEFNLRLNTSESFAPIYLPEGWIPGTRRFETLGQKPNDKDSPVVAFAGEFVEWENGLLEQIRKSGSKLPPLVVHKASGIVCRLIPGTGPKGYAMGDPTRPLAINSQLSDFYLQDTEVTYGQSYAAGFNNRTVLDRKSFVRFDELPSHLHRPITYISYQEATEFAELLHARLPTSAQWEFAAKSRGRNIAYVWSDRGLQNEDDAKLHADHFSDLDFPNWVMTKKNDRTDQLIFDLTGHVREWVRDYVPEKGKSAPRNELDWCQPKSDNANRVTFRGGSFLSSDPNESWTFFVSSPQPDNDSSLEDVGFRLVLDRPHFLPVETDLPNDGP